MHQGKIKDFTFYGKKKRILFYVGSISALNVVFLKVSVFMLSYFQRFMT